MIKIDKSNTLFQLDYNNKLSLFGGNFGMFCDVPVDQATLYPVSVQRMRFSPRGTLQTILALPCDPNSEETIVEATSLTNIDSEIAFSLKKFKLSDLKPQSFVTSLTGGQTGLGGIMLDTCTCKTNPKTAEIDVVTCTIKGTSSDTTGTGTTCPTSALFDEHIINTKK